MSNDLDALKKRLVANQPAYTHSAYLLGVDAALAALEQDSMHDDTGYCHQDEPFTHADDHPVYRISPEPPKGT